MDKKKTIEVVAAIIKKDNKIFVTQRGYGEFKDKWEFPGGKIELNETKEEALKREIKEELKASIIIDEFIGTIQYEYEKFNLIMHNFLCRLENNEFTLLEHEAAKFVSINELDKIDFLPADILVINILKNKTRLNTKYFLNIYTKLSQHNSLN